MSSDFYASQAGEIADEGDREPTRLEGHVNAAEYWIRQADLYEFPNAIRAECLQLASVHAALAQALAAMTALEAGRYPVPATAEES